MSHTVTHAGKIYNSTRQLAWLGLNKNTFKPNKFFTENQRKSTFQI